MKLLSAHKHVTIILLFTIACTVLLLVTVVHSSTLLFQHWALAMAPCVECSKTFWRYILLPNNITATLFFAWSAVCILRGVLFVRHEYTFQALDWQTDRHQSMVFVNNTPLAAWTSGILRQNICINIAFWHLLNTEEQKALCEHEQHHIDHRESLLFFLLGWCRAIIWLPILAKQMKVFVRNQQLRSEICADKKAMDATSNVVVASVLYKALQFEQAQYTSIAPGINTHIHMRIAHITSGNSSGAYLPAQRWFLLACLGAISVVVCFFLLHIEAAQGCL